MGEAGVMGSELSWRVLGWSGIIAVVIITALCSGVFVYSAIYMDKEPVKFDESYFQNKTLPHHHVMQNLGVSLFQRGRYEEAKVVLIHSLEARTDILRNKFKTHALLAEIYIREGNDSSAWQQYQETIAIEPRFAPVYTRMAQLCLKYGQPDNAEKLMKVGLSLDPSLKDGDKVLEYAAKLKGLRG